MMTHVMVDLETMAATSDAAVLSAGLVEFNSKEIIRSTEIRCTSSGMRLAGRKFDTETLEWWLRQSDEARKLLLAEPRHDSIDSFVDAIVDWFPQTKDMKVWGKGPSFDLVILRDMMGDRTPWHYFQECCVRTMLLVAKANQWTEILEKEPEVAHGAESDALHQARQVQEVMRKVRP